MQDGLTELLACATSEQYTESSQSFKRFVPKIVSGQDVVRNSRTLCSIHFVSRPVLLKRDTCILTTNAILELHICCDVS